MPDYSKTVIYKIQHEGNESLVYIGSTTDFTKRKCSHKRTCNNPNNRMYNVKLYTMIRDNGGWNCFRMIQIKKFPCDNKREAETEEDRIMMELKANMNVIRASRSQAEWYIDNRDKISEQHKKYHANNRDKILEQTKQYRIDNRDKILEKQKQNYNGNRDKISEKRKQKMTCECGCVVRKSDISSHRKSKKHLELLKQSQ